MDKLRMTCFMDHLRTTFHQSQSIVLLFIFHSDKYKNTLTTSFTKFVRCNSLTKEMVNDLNTDIKNGLVGFYSARVCCVPQTRVMLRAIALVIFPSFQSG